MQSIRPRSNIHSVLCGVEALFQLFRIFEIALYCIASELGFCSNKVKSCCLANHASSAIASHKPPATEGLVLSSLHRYAIHILCDYFGYTTSSEDCDP